MQTYYIYYIRSEYYTEMLIIPTGQERKKQCIKYLQISRYQDNISYIVDYFHQEKLQLSYPLNMFCGGKIEFAHTLQSSKQL